MTKSTRSKTSYNKKHRFEAKPKTKERGLNSSQLDIEFIYNLKKGKRKQGLRTP